MQEKEVTCILTSCGRFDLLEITLDSFFVHNTYPVKEFIVHEDGGYGMPGRAKWEKMGVKFIHRATNTPNQITALDILWNMVETPYAFCMEDDWETITPGCIEDSMAVLESNPKILQCWLHEKETSNQHPVVWQNGYGILKPDGGLWSGTRFAPALKRKADYDLIGSYGKYATFDREKPWKAEATISQIYHKFGFSGAILPKHYIRHIGQNRHIGI